MRGLALMLLAAIPGTAAAGAVPGPVSVSIVDAADGGYEVRGAFDVAASPEVAWSVLTDYERIGEFVKSIRKSVVVERVPDHILLEQEGVGKVLIFSKRAHVVLWVTEQDGRRIQFRDTGGRDFTVYHGGWQIDTRDDVVHVSYSLTATLKSRRPAFLARTGFQDGARKLLSEVRAEIGRRAGDPGAASTRRGIGFAAHDPCD
jgi:hypothetical protein